MHDGELTEDFLRLWATFPFKFVDVQEDGGFQLNGDDFIEAAQGLDKH
jgi:hypothetical protein